MSLRTTWYNFPAVYVAIKFVKFEGKNRGEEEMTPVTTACPEAGK